MFIFSVRPRGDCGGGSGKQPVAEEGREVSTVVEREADGREEGQRERGNGEGGEHVFLNDLEALSTTATACTLPTIIIPPCSRGDSEKRLES